MEDRVGNSNPTQAMVDQLTATAQSLVQQLTAFCLILSLDERKGAKRPRIGGEKHVERTASLCKEYGVAVRGVTPEGMLRDLELARLLRPLAPPLAMALQFVTDTALQAGSEYWEAYLALYGALSAAAEHDPQLAKDLEPLKAFMAAPANRRQANQAMKEQAVADAQAEANPGAESASPDGAAAQPTKPAGTKTEPAT